MNPKIKNNKGRLYLFPNKRRGGTWYLREYKDGKLLSEKSLGTKDEKEAHELASAKYSVLKLGNSHAAKMAKVYQQLAGEEYVKRTWSDCFDAFNDPRIKSESSIITYASHWQHTVFDSIKDRTMADTDKSDLSTVLKNATASGRNLMIYVHKYAVDNHWLFQSLITKTTKDATKRKLGDSTATLELHEYKAILGAIDKTIAKPKNNNLASASEFKDWMILLWHVGGSSDDMANLKLANLDYSGDQPCIIYKRAKHRGTKTKMGGKTREPVKFPVGETLKALMLKRINMANQKGHELLFPLMSNKTSSARLKIFDKYLKYAGINKIKVEEGGVERSIKLHSFRYAVACRMAECGISLRDAQYYLGHNCSAVARYYAGRASVKMEPLEDIEARCKATQEAVTKVA